VVTKDAQRSKSNFRNKRQPSRAPPKQSKLTRLLYQEHSALPVNSSASKSYFEVLSSPSPPRHIFYITLLSIIKDTDVRILTPREGFYNHKRRIQAKTWTDLITTMASLQCRSIIVIDDEDVVEVDDNLTILDHGTIHLPLPFYIHLCHQNPLLLS
jgi:hypothetical protein